MTAKRGVSVALNRAIYKIAHQQNGVVSSKQLYAAGLTSGQIKSRVGSGLLIPIFRGVFQVGYAPHDDGVRFMAAVLGAGPGAVLSHRSAGAAWELCRQRGPVHVSRVQHARPPGPNVRVHRPRRLDATETARVGAIPVTSVERTLIDLATDVRDRELNDAYSAARRLKLLDSDRLRTGLNRAARRPGIAGLTALHNRFEPLDVVSRSELQDRILDAVLKSELPDPEVEVPIGRFVVDMLWRAQCLICEVDGRKWHEDRFDEDRQKDLELAAMGFKTIRVTHRMIEGGTQDVLSMIQAALSNTGTID